MEHWIELSRLSAEVAIVVTFLWYLSKRDKEISRISERCHQTQEAGHEAIKELTIAIRTSNGRQR